MSQNKLLIPHILSEIQMIKNILEYAQIARTGPKSMFRNIEGI